MAKATLHKILQNHNDEVNSIAFSPDSKLIASASWDQTVRLWNLPNGDLNAELKGHKSLVFSVSFSPDGKSIVTGSWDKTVRTWSIVTKKQLKTLNGHSNSVCSVAWSPNGDVIASGSYDATVILWDTILGSMKKKLKGHTERVASVSFSQNGNKLASAGYDETAIIWDVDSGAALIILTHYHAVLSVCFSHDQFVLTGCDDKIVRMFNANTGREEKRFRGHTSPIFSVACSFDGSIIASGSYDNSVRLWDVASAKQLQQLDGHKHSVYSVAFSHDGKFIASGSKDETVRLWNTPSMLQAAAELEKHKKELLAKQQEIEKQQKEIEHQKAKQQKREQEIADRERKHREELEKQKQLEEAKKAQAAAELEKQKKELATKQQEIERQQKIAEELEKQKQFTQKENELIAKQQEIERQKKEIERQKGEQQKREQEIADRERKQSAESEKQKKQEETKKATANLDRSQLAEWSVDDVCAYLKQSKIEDDVILIFRKERIKGKSLASKAKDEVLKSMGINAMGDREDVIDAINKLVSPSRGANTGLKLHEIPSRELAKNTKLSDKSKFGIVWRGTYNGIPVALKEPILYGDADLNATKQLADLVEEATVMTSISAHPNVLHCYGISRVGDNYLLVIELCNLGSLDAFLRAYPGTPAVDRRRFSQQVARGLNHLGKHNVAHRDVAARNVLLHDQGGGVIVAKVCDFGLSRQREGEYYLVTGEHLVSPETAPEVFTTGKHSSRSDVWSFGVLLWEVESLCATRAEPNKVAFPPLSKPAKASDNMYEIMLKCWAKDPHQRPSFEALIDMLA